ncbi:MAG: hypothetical protein ABIQ95_12550 [Bdellovibrionia bacterium]
MEKTQINTNISASAKSYSNILPSFYLGLSLCLFQIAFTWLFAPKDPRPLTQYYQMEVAPDWDIQSSPNPFLNGYQRFNNWDSLRFFEIAQNGYHLPADGKPIENSDIHQYRANITNLPTYPLLTRYIQETFHLPAQYALLVAAQLACFIFWFYFSLFFLDRNFTKKEALVAAITFGFAPGAFYLVCGYSESTLLAAAMGLIYWTDRFMSQLRKRSEATQNLKINDNQHHRQLPTPLKNKTIVEAISWIAIAAHGFLATFSRLPAIPLAIYPFLKNVFIPTSRPANIMLRTNPTFYLNGIILSLLSSSGLIAFFFFCQYKFGSWDIYFHLSKLVGQQPDYWAIFKPSSYIPKFFFEDTQLSMNRAMVPWLVAIAGIALRLDLQKARRLPLYIIAAGLFYITVAGKSGGGMDGMIRYALPIYLPLVLCLATVIKECDTARTLPKMISKKNTWWIAVFYLFSLSCQAWCAYRYLHGKWVS